MSHKIAILRGINVGGKRKVLMSDLKALCKELDWKNVRTYIQSGNIIFNSNKKHTELETSLEKIIKDKYDFEVPVIVRSSEDLQLLINKNPYDNENTDIKQLHLTFLKVQPTKENIKHLLTYNFEPDKFEIWNKEVFIFCKGKYHKSKVSNGFIEKN